MSGHSSRLDDLRQAIQASNAAAAAAYAASAWPPDCEHSTTALPSTLQSWCMKSCPPCFVAYYIAHIKEANQRFEKRGGIFMSKEMGDNQHKISRDQWRRAKVRLCNAVPILEKHLQMEMDKDGAKTSDRNKELNRLRGAEGWALVIEALELLEKEQDQCCVVPGFVLAEGEKYQGYEEDTEVDDGEETALDTEVEDTVEKMMAEVKENFQIIIEEGNEEMAEKENRPPSDSSFPSMEDPTSSTKPKKKLTGATDKVGVDELDEELQEAFNLGYEADEELQEALNLDHELNEELQEASNLGAEVITARETECNRKTPSTETNKETGRKLAVSDSPTWSTSSPKSIHKSGPRRSSRRQSFSTTSPASASWNPSSTISGGVDKKIAKTAEKRMYRKLDLEAKLVPIEEDVGTEEDAATQSSTPPSTSRIMPGSESPIPIVGPYSFSQHASSTKAESMVNNVDSISEEEKLREAWFGHVNGARGPLLKSGKELPNQGDAPVPNSPWLELKAEPTPDHEMSSQTNTPTSPNLSPVMTSPRQATVSASILKRKAKVPPQDSLARKTVRILDFALILPARPVIASDNLSTSALMQPHNHHTTAETSHRRGRFCRKRERYVPCTWASPQGFEKMDTSYFRTDWLEVERIWADTAQGGNEEDDEVAPEPASPSESPKPLDPSSPSNASTMADVLASPMPAELQDDLKQHEEKGDEAEETAKKPSEEPLRMSQAEVSAVANMTQDVRESDTREKEVQAAEDEVKLQTSLRNIAWAWTLLVLLKVVGR
ncbi:hypothetical protein K504DRAFT_504430 [Pleomassaria siparia CBS 279.74]|uniref:Uncharacterized protein n=1 Tax=Pleomassaria siparia CBS 279.74 TaxID=1314801 RepID=A0A6G1K316_9PLEO|nr:hypothetical protein K504DRAFT_504430 [Pleomassaria siparia CBS 279.74]